MMRVAALLPFAHMLRLWGMLLLVAAITMAAGPVVDNGCPNQNGVQQLFCSKLGAGERITVQATECGYSTTCPTASAEVCRSIINDSAVSYFVPWRTRSEWGAFLSQLTPMTPMRPGAEPLPANNLAVSRLPNVSVAPCCPPQQVPPICPGYPCKPSTPGYPSCSSLAAHGIPDQLGYRRVGARIDPAVDGDPPLERLPPLENFGAQNDVYGPIRAPDLFGDATINYEVTYSCSNGVWVKSYEIGSCTPVAGACNPAVPTNLPNGWTPPTDLNQLCDMPAGSTFVSGSFTDAGDRYRWQCAGTPTMGVADCEGFKYVPPSVTHGACGTAHNGRLPNPPIMPAELCAAGTAGPLTGLGTDASPWVWACNGVNGGNNQPCKAYLVGTPLAGICGAANGYKAPYPSWRPAAYQQCVRTATPATLTQSGDTLSWICFGESGGADVACSMTLPQVAGLCGVPSGYLITTPPAHDPPTAADLPSGACSSGTPGNIAYNNLTNSLSWNCLGVNGGADIACDAVVDTGYIAGKCNWPPNTAVGTTPAMTSAALCMSGTAENIVSAGAAPNIRLEWLCRGNRVGADETCSINIKTRVDGVCGNASGMALPAQPTAPDLCSAGTASAVSGGALGPVWGWNCAGINGGLTAYCGAVYDGTPSKAPVPVNGVCNPAMTTAQAVRPSANLCLVGTPNAVVGTGPWSWQCAGFNGGAADNCTAPLLGAAACGLTHGTYIPGKPNSNLCNAGTPGNVTGNKNDGWSWQCVGATTVSCHANPCDACVGKIPAESHVANFTALPLSYGAGTCVVQGRVEWKQRDKLTSSNATYSLTLANSATGLSYSKPQLPPAAPLNYCAPCYRSAEKITDAEFTVRRAATGNCSTGTSLDTGGTKTLPVTDISFP